MTEILAWILAGALAVLAAWGWLRKPRVVAAPPSRPPLEPVVEDPMTEEHGRIDAAPDADVLDRARKRWGPGGTG